MNIIKRIKRFWYRLRNSNPVRNCPVFKDRKFCVFVFSPRCKSYDCPTLQKYFGYKWTRCGNCKLSDECCNKNYGFGCYNGIKREK